MTTPGSLGLGTYYFTLVVTDDLGNTAEDYMVLTIAQPLPPTSTPDPIPSANAGVDQTFMAQSNDMGEMWLEGSGSTDADGTITAYEWRQGTTFLSEEVAFGLMLPVGVHEITLTVYDNDGYSDTDTVIITVEPYPTETLTETEVVVETPTDTITETPTFTPTDTFTATFTPSDTATFTLTLTHTFTPSITPSFTSTFTPSHTASLTPTVTPTFAAASSGNPTYAPCIVSTGNGLGNARWQGWSSAVHLHYEVLIDRDGNGLFEKPCVFCKPYELKEREDPLMAFTTYR